MNIVYSVSCIHCQIHRSDLDSGRRKGEEQRRGGGRGGRGRVALRRQGLATRMSLACEILYLQGRGCREKSRSLSLFSVLREDNLSVPLAR